jgi:RecA-family ATPase
MTPPREYPDAFDEIVEASPISDKPTMPRPPNTDRHQHPPPRFLTLTEFLGAFEPIRFQVDGVIRSGSLYTLTAKTGHGKTALMVTIAYAVATGSHDILKRKVERGRVAYISAENPDDLRMRLAVAADRLNVDVADVSEWMTVLDRAASPEALLAELTRLSERKHFSFIEIDTLAAMFDGKNVNDPQEAGDYMRRLRPLTRLPTSPTVLVAAHPTKNASADQERLSRPADSPRRRRDLE